MKKLLLTILTLVAVSGSISNAQAVSGNCFYFGGRLETSDQPGKHELYATYGTAFRLASLGNHTSLWNFSSLDAGKYGAVSNDIGLAVGLTTKFGVGLLAGPNVDWITNIPTGGDAPTVYLATAVGGFVTYDFTDRFGVWGMTKYKFSAETGNLYPSGSVAGLGLLVRF